MSISIGIDLGDRNTVVAFTSSGSNPRVLVNREMLEQTPSVVARHREGKLLVGASAVRVGNKDPRNVILSVRRLIGRRYQDKEVEIVQKHVSYRIVPSQDGGGGLANVMIGDKQYSPIEVSALILKKMKEDAEDVLGEPVTHAVITVPAYFDDNQREATRQAGALAGLKVKRIIDEPTAAAYAFGMDLNMAEARAVVVYDLGGGTFDISVIFIGSGVPTVEAIGGDIWLGGDRFDNAIIDFVLRKYPGQKDVLRGDVAFMLELKTQAEQAKKDIAGGAPSADVVIVGALRGKLDIEVTVSAEQFDDMIRHDVEASIKTVDDTVARANMSVVDIDHVLLVGGSTRLPMIRRLLVAKFGAGKVKTAVNPSGCVALGAAILASRPEKKLCPKQNCGHQNESDADRCSECGAELTDIAAHVARQTGGGTPAGEPDLQQISEIGGPDQGLLGGSQQGAGGSEWEGSARKIDPQVLIKLAVIGAHHIADGAPDYFAWSKALVGEADRIIEWAAKQSGQETEAVIREVYRYAAAVAAKHGFTMPGGGENVAEGPRAETRPGNATIQPPVVAGARQGKGQQRQAARNSEGHPPAVDEISAFHLNSSVGSKTNESSLSPDDPSRLQLMAVCLLNVGRAADVERLLLRLDKLEDPCLQFYLALAYARQEKVDEAVAIFLRLLEREPDNDTVRRAAIALLHRHAVRLINARNVVPAAHALDDALTARVESPKNM